MTSNIAPGALAGIRVIDLSRVLGGPFCGQILGDHGADVLKVEPPQGDDTRAWGPPFRDGVASYYLGLNRNKQGTRLDLASPGGREMLLELLRDADVLIENFKTGTMEKWGLSYEQLSQQFPRPAFLLRVGQPDFGQALIGRHLPGQRAQVCTLHMGLDAGLLQQVAPQGGHDDVGCRDEPEHAATVAMKRSQPAEWLSRALSRPSAARSA